MKTTLFTMTSEAANASGPVVAAPYVITYMETGHLPPEVFKILEGGLSEGSQTSEASPADAPLFGTHIREAIEILRGRR